MASIIVDSGPLLALFNRADRHHEAAVAFVRDCTAELVTNLPVVTEVTYLLHRLPRARLDFLGWIAAAATIDLGTCTDLHRIADLLAKYDDLPADFADASLVALAERRSIADIATVDRDFTIYRTLSGKALRNVLQR